MTYRVVGIMSGSSLDGLDLIFAEFLVDGGKWKYEIIKAGCYPYQDAWYQRLKEAPSLSAKDYLILHADYGRYIGENVNRFIELNDLQYKVAFISSHGHTSFHLPEYKVTAQLGDGSAIAAITQLPVISDLRSMDVALGGQGAPIVPVGEKLLLPEYKLFLNLGGIANISWNRDGNYAAFDICPANRVLNMLAQTEGEEFDKGGAMAARGNINAGLLEKLNALEYYTKPYPKSLSNNFGINVVFPMVQSFRLSAADRLRTFSEHIVVQIKNALQQFMNQDPAQKLLVTGGGAFNTFLISRLTNELQSTNIEVIVPDRELVEFKEALIMAFIGVLRWRLEYNVMSSVTGAERNSIGGTVWIGHDA